MGHIVALVDAETALGFRLAGIDGRTVGTAEDLAREARDAAEDPEARLVLVDERLFRLLPDRLQRALDASRSPVFVAVPAARLRGTAATSAEQVARLMRRVIGYQIRIRR
ncbi:MAG: V-type ATP synthase subunit F [Gemmatimonadota bacterium]